MAVAITDAAPSAPVATATVPSVEPITQPYVESRARTMSPSATLKSDITVAPATEPATTIAARSNVSAPPPPLTASAAAPLIMRSFPAAPLIESALAVPVMVFAPLEPVSCAPNDPV